MLTLRAQQGLELFSSASRVEEGNSDTNNKQGRQSGNGIFNAHIYYMRIVAVAISITMFARESLTSTRRTVLPYAILRISGDLVLSTMR